ncbi:MAG TPA: peptidoglycan DD-metalloendopeptidase family protein [Rhizomicrobium sp.]|jgi:murein DD-endopeptidase MepM/ murein hydrolase activator NlpD
MCEGRAIDWKRGATVLAMLLPLLLSACIDPNDRKTQLDWGTGWDGPAEAHPVATYYTVHVRPGDTLAQLSDRYDVSAESVARLNGIDRHAAIHSGETLRIPAGARATRDAVYADALATPSHSNPYIPAPPPRRGGYPHDGVAVATLAPLKGAPVSAGPITPIGGYGDFDTAPVVASKAPSHKIVPGAADDEADTAPAPTHTPAPHKKPDGDASATQVVASATSATPHKPASDTSDPQIASAKHRNAAKDDTVVASNTHPHGMPAWYSPAQPLASSDAEPVSQSQAQTPSVQQQQRVPGSGRFVWPVSGRVIATFGSSANGERNDGINIAAKAGEPIRAAASGTVTYAGNQLRSYGNLLLIKHDDGYVTAYAHAETILVQKGDHVLKGQVIGSVGQTGDVTQPQLHFEIRNGVQPVNPLALLVASR